MRIILLGWGSRGDVQPLIALGRGLRRAGHEVGVAALLDHAADVTGAGLVHEPIHFRLADFLHSEQALRWLGGTATSLHQELLAMRAVSQLSAAPQVDLILDAVPRYDLVISGLLSFDAARAACVRFGKQHLYACFTPLTPTRSGGAYLYPLLPNRYSLLNYAWSRYANARSYDLMRAPGDLIRDRLGQRREANSGYGRAVRSTMTLMAISPHVVPPPADQARWVRYTGYWFESTPDYRPDPALVAVLAAGPPPVYVGFGSMPSAAPEATTDLVVAAARQAGRRVVLHAGSSGLGAKTVHDDVHVIGSVPHDWLFPRTAGVIHHGGAGTTAAALRAGVPTAVVWHFGDQPYWGRRVAALGVGPSPLPQRALTVSRLARQFAALARPEYANRAARLGGAIRAEDGVGRAVDIIEGGTW